MACNRDDSLEEVIKNTLEKVNILKDYVSLHFRRDELSSELNQFEERLPNIQQALFNCHTLLTNFEESIRKEYMQLVDTMRRQQMAMLYVLGEIRKKDSTVSERQLRTPLSVMKPRNGHIALETPRIYLSEYKNSPYVSNVRPVTLYFLDFDAVIPQQVFNNIPKYLRGRETFDEINYFLQNVIVPCFTEKYQLLHRKRECVRNPRDLDVWKLYREQVSYFPGQKFITQGDISRKLEKTVDKKTCTRIAMLRQLGILQEQRKSSVVCYIWIANNSSNNE